MNSFTDYYETLGVDVDAPASAIKTAFKKLALQYHPDIYKGEDAQERMRVLLLAYQTLNDPEARKQYDAQRSEYFLTGRVIRASSAQNASASTTRSTSVRRANASEVSPMARRDRQRYYDFPDFRSGSPVHIDLIDTSYDLAPHEAQALQEQGMLRGIAPETEGHTYYCHRCHHRWSQATQRGERNQIARESLPRFCPRCSAIDWPEYLLLRCTHCCAVFESEQIRYEIGAYSYGKAMNTQQSGTPALCPPYELFPLCPYCGTAHWCPAEEARVDELRLHLAQRAARLRLLWMSIAILTLLLLGSVGFALLKH